MVFNTKITSRIKAKILVSVFVLILFIILFFIAKPDAFSFISKKISMAIMSTSTYVIYNGENIGLSKEGRPCIENAEEVSPGRGESGKALKLTPHINKPSTYIVHCGEQNRLDFSAYANLEFYIKGDIKNEGIYNFSVTSYYGTGKTVDILQYIEGKEIDDIWRKVRIPISDLKTISYNLNTVDTLYFGSDTDNQVFYIDDLTLTNIISEDELKSM